MSATDREPDRRRAATDAKEDSDHAFFRELEAVFIRLRGAPLLLSPDDWQLAREWHRQGIPLSLVERVIGEVLEKRRRRLGADSIVSLRYFRRPVESAWEALAALQASGIRGPGEICDAGSRLRLLAGSVPAELPGAAAARARILALEGDAEAIEEALIALEAELLKALASDLPAAVREEIESGLQRTLGRIAERLSDGELTAVRARLLREAVRRHYRLPVLSLFAASD